MFHKKGIFNLFHKFYGMDAKQSEWTLELSD